MCFRSLLLSAAVALVVVALAGPASAVDSAFTYQGHLVLSGVPVTGTYDFEFSLHDDPATGTQVGAAVAADDLAVSEGLFQAPLDFGAAAFDGAPRWLQIAVRDGAWTESLSALSPRTPISRTPYAIHALKADTATSATFAVHSASADSATNAGFATMAASADHATSAAYAQMASAAAHANLATLADTATSAALASDSAALGGQPPAAFAASGHTHTGATIVDASIDAVDLASNAASLVRVSGGAVVADGAGNIGIGTNSPNERLDVRGSAAVTGGVSLGTPVEGSISYDPGNSILRIGTNGSGVDQKQEAVTHSAGGSTFWQSFTPGVAGNLYQVDVRRGFSDQAATVTLSLHRGEGSSGPVLGSGILPALNVGQRAWQSFPFSSPIPVSAGEKYTIRLSTLSGGTVRWNNVEGGDRYPAGRFSDFGAGTDATFRTYIEGPQANLTVSSSDGGVTVTQSLTVLGQAYKPGGGSWATISDSRTKKNISTISGALERLLKLRGVNYQWKEPAAVGAEDNSPLMGLVADEVEQVFPEWITRGPDGLRRLEIIGFEGLTVEALKEIQSRHDQDREELESRIKLLQTQNEVLNRRLEKLEKQSTK